MSKLVIHIGAPKCGSSSIQNFFETQRRPCIEKTHYVMLDPVQVSQLNLKTPLESSVTAITKLLTSNINKCDVLILSHEFLFQCPYSIERICTIAKDLVSDIVIVGYCRKQSNFMISAYHQWGFRQPEKVKSAITSTEDLGLETALFSGLERHLIASIVNDFEGIEQSKQNVQDWYISYHNISRLLQDSSAIVKCGVIQGKDAAKSLIQDFCELSNLSLKKKISATSEKVVNASFNQNLVEAMNNAIYYGIEIPPPHDFNDEINEISNIMTKTNNVESQFLTSLKAYVDTFYMNSNNQLCENYGLNKEYFSPTKQLNKSQILNIIKNEGMSRTADSSVILNQNRMLSAQMAVACIEIIQKHQRDRTNPFAAKVIDKFRLMVTKLFS
jgi:hypothetical protein